MICKIVKKFLLLREKYNEKGIPTPKSEIQYIKLICCIIGLYCVLIGLQKVCSIIGGTNLL